MRRLQSLRVNIVAALLVGSMVFSGPLWAESMVSVVTHSFCRGITNLEPVDIVSDPAQLKSGESLHLWLEIKINRSGLKYLRALGKLPVYVRWGRDGWLTDPPLDVGIASSAWSSNRNGIDWKASQGNGAFTWRTHTNKVAPTNGRYYASILDANKKVITTVEFPSEPFRPEITVSRE